MTPAPICLPRPWPGGGTGSPEEIANSSEALVITMDFEIIDRSTCAGGAAIYGAGGRDDERARSAGAPSATELPCPILRIRG